MQNMWNLSVSLCAVMNSTHTHAHTQAWQLKVAERDPRVLRRHNSSLSVLVNSCVFMRVQGITNFVQRERRRCERCSESVIYTVRK